MLTSKSFAALSLCALLGLTSMANASSSLVVDRGLPDAHLNNAAGGDRSNVRWGSYAGTDDFYGDSFVINSPGAWQVDTVRVWVLATSGGVGGNLGDLLSSMTLYLGNSVNGMAAAQTGNFTSSSGTDNTNISITAVTYAGGADYQSAAGTYQQIWQVDFTNLNYGVTGGDEVQFGVWSAEKSGVNPKPIFFLHASNDALSGTPQEGSDGLFLGFDHSNLLAAPTVYNSDGPPLWDKSSDINVQVFATAVPEPSALISAGLGALILGGIGAIRRRNRRAAA